MTRTEASISVEEIEKSIKNGLNIGLARDFVGVANQVEAQYRASPRSDRKVAFPDSNIVLSFEENIQQGEWYTTFYVDISGCSLEFEQLPGTREQILTAIAMCEYLAVNEEESATQELLRQAMLAVKTYFNFNNKEDGIAVVKEIVSQWILLRTKSAEIKEKMNGWVNDSKEIYSRLESSPTNQQLITAVVRAREWIDEQNKDTSLLSESAWNDLNEFGLRVSRTIPEEYKDEKTRERLLSLMEELMVHFKMRFFTTTKHVAAGFHNKPVNPHQLLMVLEQKNGLSQMLRCYPAHLGQKLILAYYEYIDSPIVPGLAEMAERLGMNAGTAGYHLSEMVNIAKAFLIEI